MGNEDTAEGIEVVDAAPMAPPEITIGRHTVTLEEPSPLFSYALGLTRLDAERIQDAGQSGTAKLLAHGAAALLMSWPGSVTFPVRPKPKAWRPGLDVVEYGDGVYTALRRATRSTVHLRDLNSACFAAREWGATCMLTEAEIRAAQDFTEAAGE